GLELVEYAGHFGNLLVIEVELVGQEAQRPAHAKRPAAESSKAAPSSLERFCAGAVAHGISSPAEPAGPAARLPAGAAPKAKHGKNGKSRSGPVARNRSVTHRDSPSR